MDTDSITSQTSSTSHTRHKCEHCSVTTSRKHDLKRHKMLKHGEKKPTIEIKTQHLEEEQTQAVNMISCEFCETKFSRKSSLNRHLKTKHTNHMIWCEYCLFTTTRKDEFVKHMKKNHGEKDKYKSVDIGFHNMNIFLVR